jgi:type IV secretory pathway VirB4 component
LFLKEFKALRRERGRLLGLPDQLNYAIPIDDTIAMKDGAFLSSFECSGLDLNSARIEELDAHRAQANRALAPGRWLHVQHRPHPSSEYRLPEPYVCRSS